MRRAASWARRVVVRVWTLLGMPEEANKATRKIFGCLSFILQCSGLTFSKIMQPFRSHLFSFGHFYPAEIPHI